MGAKVRVGEEKLRPANEKFAEKFIFWTVHPSGGSDEGERELRRGRRKKYKAFQLIEAHQGFGDARASQ